MSVIEKRIVIDEATERMFLYTDEGQFLPATWSGLLEVRHIQRLMAGVSYANRVYTWTGAPLDELDIQLDFEADRAALAIRGDELDLAMTWNYQPDRSSVPRLVLDGDHTNWSPN